MINTDYWSFSQKLKILEIQHIELWRLNQRTLTTLL